MPRSKSLFADFRRRWARIPQSNRMWIICLIALTLTIAACLMSVQQNPASELLLAGRSFTARDLIAMEGAFAKSGLGDYEVVGSTVRIPRQRRSEYVAALVDAHIVPAASGIAAMPATGPFDFSSAGQRGDRQRVVLQQELSEVVRQFQDIDDATVRIDEAVVGQGFQRQKRLTAMVVVRPVQSHLSVDRIRSIGRLVASAKVGLTEDDVSVTDMSTGRCYGGNSVAPVNYRQTDDYVLRKREAEEQWSAKIAQAVNFIPGVKVAANVDLLQNSKSHDGIATPDVRVAVSVPQSYYQAVWSEHRKVATHDLEIKPEETTLAAIEHKTRERINQTIAPLLPSTAVKNEASPRIAVVSVPDLPIYAGKNAPLVVGGFADWFRSNVVWSILALLGATVLGFYALRGVGKDIRRVWLERDVEDSHALRVVRDAEDRYREPVRPRYEREMTTVPVAADEVSIGETRYADHNESTMQTVADEDRSLAAVSTQATDDIFADGPSPVNEELTQIVRENPDAAADLLKQWIDKAG